MARGIVTINTDASYSYKFKKASFAFWIVSDEGKMCKSGVLKGNTKTPTHGEFKSIINALHCLFACLKWSNVKYIVVNTDSLNTIHIVQKNKVLLRKFRIYKEDFKEELAAWNYIKGHYIKKEIKIEFRHVKAHKDVTTPREWVNQWCDINAKSVLAKELNLPPL